AGITARLSVGVWASVASGLLPRALSALHLDHPGIEVRTSELAPEETADAVRDGLLDMSFVIDYSSHTIDPDPALQRSVVA
ncbi:LysR substrate-binding domain-containing protein, partial [Klebsiella pneumoniae]|nr:LysR substrate-binding domain-containing protein [Klebsiella pneumoniae]